MTTIPEALAAPFLDPGDRTWWAALVLALCIAVPWHLRYGGFSWRQLLHASTALDVQLLVARQLLLALGWLPALGGGLWLATHGVRWLDATVGAPGLAWPPAVVTALYTAALFVTWDLSRYVLHRLMHEVPALWELHQVHHSAEVLTPLTFHRVHPLESLLYGLRGALVTGTVAATFYWLFRDAAVEWTILGVHGVGLLFNAATGNLRHSHVWIRFGPAVEHWLVSPAQHQLHHALGTDRRNYGTWLAVWDRLGGSLQVAGPTPPERFGLAHANHRHDLISAWLGPLRGVARVAVPLVVLALPARAAEPDDADLEVIVEAEGGKPRVAGSAHVISEEELEQYEADDIHQVLAKVPGVYVRGEDGFGLRPNIGIRGANSDRSAKITLLEDGVLLAPAPYSAPAAYYFPMVTRMVGVEVFKGPAAIQHGPHTVGGAINLLSRRPPSETAGAVDLGIGLRNTRKLHAWTGSGGERWGFLAEGVYLGTDGFKHLDGGGPTGFDRGELVVRTRYGDERQAVELKLGYAHELSNETYLGLQVDDFAVDPYRRYAASQAGEMVWDRTLVEVAWPVSIGDVDVRTVAYHHGLHRSWAKFNRFAGGPDVHDLLQQPEGGASAVYLAILRGEEDSATPDQTLLIGTNDRTFAAAGVQTRARWPRYGNKVSSRLEGGLRLHGDRIDRLHTEDPYQMRSGRLVADGGPTDTLVDSRASALALAGHVHEDLELSGLHLIPGVRVEAIQTERTDSDAGRVLRTIALPGLGVLYEVSPALDVFVGSHRGFSPVPPGEAADVKPETSWNVEGGFRAGTSGPRLELVGYANDYVNLTGQCTISGGCMGDDLDRQFNGGHALVYGAEGSAGHELLLPARVSVPLEVAYTWTRGTFRTGFVSGFPQFGAVEAGDFLPYVPEHQGAARLSVAHPRGRVGAALNYRSGMLDIAGPLPVPEDTGIPPLVTLDLAADVAVHDGVTGYATATNVTGASPVVSWRPFGARPPAPLQIMLGLKVEPTARR